MTDHERLVEAVAQELERALDEGSGGDFSFHKEWYVTTATAAIAIISERLEEPTPEMVGAGTHGDLDAHSPHQAAWNIFTAMVKASPLYERNGG